MDGNERDAPIRVMRVGSGRPRETCDCLRHRGGSWTPREPLHQRRSLLCQGTPESGRENSEVRSSGRRCAKLFQGTQAIPSGPEFDDLAAGDTEDENLGCAQQLAGRR